MRIGYGEDIHRLVEGRKLMLGGVELDYHLGEEAHSDGDVLLHATCDAILGAFALGDIGKFFPDSDESTLDMDSKILLITLLQMLGPFKIINFDSVITLEGFKLQSHIQEIRESLSSLLKTDISKISVKAKTNEGLDSLGSGGAISAKVVILLE